MDLRGRSPRTLLTAALVALLALCALTSLSFWPFALTSPAIDLFRFWVIGTVHDAFPAQLGSPYTATAEYGAALKHWLAAAGQPTVTRVAESALPLDLTATPLLYYLFALATTDYLALLPAYRAVQVGGAFAAIVAIAATRSRSYVLPVCFAVCVCVAHDALLLDVNVGNTNALQLLALTGVTVLLAAPRPASPLLPAVALLILGILLLFKPTLALAAGLLGWVCVGTSSAGRRPWWLLVAVVLVFFLSALPALYFGTWQVWGDWYHELTVTSERMAYPLAAGNVALVSYLAERLQLSIPIAAVTVAGLLLASFMLLVPCRSWRRIIAAVPPGAASAYLAVSVGIVVTLALSPLVWQHYLLLLLLPVVYLIFDTAVPGSAASLAALSLLLGLGLGRRLYQLDAGLPADWVPLSNMLAWVPAWFALLLALRAHTESHR